jgi:hypothetical protein
MARHKDENHIVFTSNLPEKNAVGACAFSAGTYPGVALRVAP